MTKEPAVYGGVEITNKIEEFLKLPSGFRTYIRMNLIQDKVRTEEAATMMKMKMKMR